MGEMLGSATSALLAFKRALDTTGNNIANVNTPGYVRQRVELSERPAQNLGSGFIGSGVQVDGITRLQERFVFDQVLEAGAQASRLERLSTLANQTDKILSDPAMSLATPLNDFFTAAADVAAQPLSTAARQSLLSDADGLLARARLQAQQLNNLDSETNAQIQQLATDANDHLAQLAKLNEAIARARGATGQEPNDLLDARDLQLNELSSLLSITATVQDDGSVNVFSASGQSLVIGTQASRFTTTSDSYATGRLELALQTPNGNVPVARVDGGELGGLYDFRRDVLDPARAQLGRVVLGTALAANTQQAAGVDQNGQRGSALFSIPSALVSPNLGNTGSATLSGQWTDAASLGTEPVILSFDGIGWSARGATTGNAFALSGAGTVVSPFQVAGLSLTVSGSAAAGDRFRLESAGSALSNLSVALKDPAGIAAASPIRTAASVSNLGDGKINSGTVLDASNPALQTPVTLQFIDATHYSINGSGSYSYSSGTAIDVNGWRVTLTGAPATGDSFSVSPTGPNSADNRNAQALAALSNQGTLNGGQLSVSGAHSALIGQVGGQARSLGVQLGAQQAIHTELTNRMDSVSGVNLDEEAANLLRFQQSYQAAAQVIAAADQMFQTLLNAVGR